MDTQPTFDFYTREAARATDPVTSVMAAEQVAPHVHAGQMKALAVFYRYPVQAFDDFELAERTGIKQTSVGKRRGELERMGYVERRERRPSPSRLTNSTVYSFRITDAGLHFYARETMR
jgi:hypothetical protein